MEIVLILMFIGTAFVFYTFGQYQLLTPQRIRKGIRGGTWESHQCNVPDNPSHLTGKDAVWRCRCGRRWKFLRTEKNKDTYQMTWIWEERTPEKDLADAQKELARLEAIEQAKAKEKLNAITRSARRRNDGGTGREPVSKVARRETER